MKRYHWIEKDYQGIMSREEKTALDDLEQLARVEIERDKILRVLGRDPKAGEGSAYDWMNSNDPELREDAAVVFADIGGHDRELRALATDKDLAVSISAKNALDATSPTTR